jgi:hypothetical protein
MFNWKNLKAEERWKIIKRELICGLLGFFICETIAILSFSFLLYTLLGCLFLFSGILLARTISLSIDYPELNYETRVGNDESRVSSEVNCVMLIIFSLGVIAFVAHDYFWVLFSTAIICLGLSIIWLSLQIQSIKLQKSYEIYETYNSWLQTVPGLFDSGQKFSINGNESFTQGVYSSALVAFREALVKFEEARKGVIGLGSGAPVGIEVIENCITTSKSNINHCEIVLDEEKVESLSKIAQNLFIESSELRKRGELFNARAKATKAEQTANEAFVITNTRGFAGANRNLVRLLEQIREEFNMIDIGMAQGVKSVKLSETPPMEINGSSITDSNELASIFQIVMPDFIEENTTGQITILIRNGTKSIYEDIQVDFSGVLEFFTVEGEISVKRLLPGMELEEYVKITPKYKKGKFPFKLKLRANGLVILKEHIIKVGGTDIF